MIGSELDSLCRGRLVRWKLQQSSASVLVESLDKKWSILGRYG